MGTGGTLGGAGRYLKEGSGGRVQVVGAEIGPQRLHDDARDRLRAGDQDVGQATRGQLDEQVVDGSLGPALDDVQADDVAADLADRGRDGAEHAGTVGQDDAQQVRHGPIVPSSGCGRVATS